ncbi:MAG: radical SAM protein [Bacteroides sp.]|nr:radical SAM protein [Ruminococcus flavefaciens]MCM1555542.1 radical SAM protein [Bacteroides sp.]
MAFFHHHIITGPIHSRRLGLSLGVNLLPTQNKVCNYDCVYCECGWNTVDAAEPEQLPAVREVQSALKQALTELKAKGMRPDSVTFSGNGEPTLHPAFGEIVAVVNDCVESFYPENPPVLTVISNATQIGRPEVAEALALCGKVLLKLDAGTPEMYARINRLRQGFRLGTYRQEESPEAYYGCLLRNLERFPYPFTVQTLLFRGENEGETIDNTSGAEWDAYVERLSLIRPQGVMLYGLDRETPAKKLQKLSAEELEAKAEELRRRGFNNVKAFF